MNRIGQQCGSGYLFPISRSLSHYGKGTEVELKQTLAYYQKAEQGFVVKVEQGDFLVKNMLTQSVDKQGEVRIQIAKELPAMKWAKKI